MIKTHGLNKMLPLLESILSKVNETGRPGQSDGLSQSDGPGKSNGPGRTLSPFPAIA